MQRAARAIWRAKPLGHDTLTAKFARVGKQDVAVATKNLVHDNARMRAAHQLCQCALALLDWRAAQLLAVEFDQVESDQHRGVAMSLVADQVEYGEALVTIASPSIRNERPGSALIAATASGNRRVKSLP
jgi:hypothetical protein